VPGKRLDRGGAVLVTVHSSPPSVPALGAKSELQSARVIEAKS